MEPVPRGVPRLEEDCRRKGLGASPLIPTPAGWDAREQTADIKAPTRGVPEDLQYQLKHVHVPLSSIKSTTCGKKRLKLKRG